MAIIYLAFGSNVGNSEDYIERAIELLSPSVHDIQKAPVYRSKAVGYTDQPDFLNTAVQGRTRLSPEELLTFIKQVEQKVGRVQRFRWGPREIDIDIIVYDDLVLESPELTIPHPAFRDRGFVLRPLLDLNPALRDPKTGQTMAQLLEKLPPGEKSLLSRI